MTPRIPTKLTLKEGRYYVRRDGKTVGPTQMRTTGLSCGGFPYRIGDETYNRQGLVWYNLESPGDLISEVPAKRIAPAAKVRKVIVRWCFTVGDSVTSRATRTLARKERRQHIEYGNACGPIERHEFALPSPKKASKTK